MADLMCLKIPALAEVEFPRYRFLGRN